MSLSALSEVEARVVRALVDSALAAECTVSVWDGEAWALRSSRDPAAIEAALCSTEVDVLNLRRAGARIGTVTLVYGNGPDVVADYSWVGSDADHDGSWVAAIVSSALKVAGVSNDC